MKIYVKYLVNDELFEDLPSAIKRKNELANQGQQVTMYKLFRTLEKDTYQLMV